MPTEQQISKQQRVPHNGKPCNNMFRTNSTSCNNNVSVTVPNLGLSLTNT
jgi:hypothetical protein